MKGTLFTLVAYTGAIACPSNGTESPSDGAIFGGVDYIRPTEQAHIEAGHAVAAIFLHHHLEIFRQSTWPTISDSMGYLEQVGLTPGPGLAEVKDRLHENSYGARFGGAYVARGVVVSNRHATKSLLCDLATARVVFGFEGDVSSEGRESIRSYPVQEVCHLRDKKSDIALMRFTLRDNDELPPPLSIGHELDLEGKVHDALVFGYPLGSSRVMGGADGNSNLRRCKNGDIRVTADTLMRSSGSPVFVPDESGSLSLVGLIEDGEHKVVRNGKERDVVVVPQVPKDPCGGKKSVGAKVVALESEISGDIQRFADNEALDPKKWACFSESRVVRRQPGCKNFQREDPWGNPLDEAMPYRDPPPS